jgi:hypothetical protein
MHVTDFLAGQLEQLRYDLYPGRRHASLLIVVLIDDGDFLTSCVW